MDCSLVQIWNQEIAPVPGAPMAIATTLGRPSRPANTLKLSDHLGTWHPAPSVTPTPVAGFSGTPAFTASASRPPPGLEFPTLLESFAAKPRLTKRMKRMALTSLIRTQEGADETCSKLDSATHSFCAELVAAVLPELPNLACDPHGIQVLSKLLSLPALSHELRCKLAQRLQGSILKLTKDCEGLIENPGKNVPGVLCSKGYQKVVVQ